MSNGIVRGGSAWQAPPQEACRPTTRCTATTLQRCKHHQSTRETLALPHRCVQHALRCKASPTRPPGSLSSYHPLHRYHVAAVQASPIHPRDPRPTTSLRPARAAMQSIANASQEACRPTTRCAATTLQRCKHHQSSRETLALPTRCVQHAQRCKASPTRPQDAR